MNIRQLVSKYIEKMTENIYILNAYQEDKEEISKMIILEKNRRLKAGFEFKEEDLAMVRIVGENNLPINLEYFPLDERNCYKYIANPFKYILGYLEHGMGEDYQNADVGCNHKEIKFKGDQLVAYRYRTTKHFSLNALTSNIYGPLGYKIEFDKGNVIIIEPLKDKLKDPRLVNLNPVDTFFDLENSSMKIGKNAIFLVQEERLESFLKEVGKEKLKDSTIFLYSDNPSLATDIVLMYYGYLPQHSMQQSRLEVEYLFKDGHEISDELYLQKFKQFIDFLNRKYLNESYLDPNDKIKENRILHAKEFIGLDGILHSETKYYKDEKKKRLQEDITTYQNYIPYIFKKSSYGQDAIINAVLFSIIKDVIELGDAPIEQTFYETTQEYEYLLFSIIKEIKYPEFKRSTEKFNELKLAKIDKRRKG